MKKIIIAGSGPVGNFMALICGLVGFDVIVYEKRKEFTRNINLKIDKDFFKVVQRILSRLNVNNDFFENLNTQLNKQNDKILIKHLEIKLSDEAKAIGVKYVTKEVKSFQEILEENGDFNAIVLDCTGRNSELRKREFGPDEDNLVTSPLQYAMYINFKAKINDNWSSSLYQAMKYIKSIKLTEIVLGKQIDENGFKDVTIPVFIKEALAKAFDKEFPDINRYPLNPFNTHSPVSDVIFHPISALLGNLVADGCKVDFNTVAVKKIVISCGYAKIRSRDNFICLGDASIYLAFFRSLNLGLKHALEFFIKLSMFCEQDYSQSDIMQQFKHHNPLLHPIKVIPTKAKNVFMIVTKVIRLGCYSFNLTTQTTERLTNALGVTENQIYHVLSNLNSLTTSWSSLLEQFEAKRKIDIWNEITSNKEKSFFFNYAAWFIEINGMSLLKISEFSRLLDGKSALFPKDFLCMQTCFRSRKEAIRFGGDDLPVKIVQSLVSFWDLKPQFHEMLNICLNSKMSIEEKLQEIHRQINLLKIPMRKKVTNFEKNHDVLNFNEKFILALIKIELKID